MIYELRKKIEFKSPVHALAQDPNYHELKEGRAGHAVFQFW